ncbi:MAG: hypothetical protein ABR574_13150 [Cryomorphaceae bacterium]
MAFLFSGFACFAQFEGEVTYKITYSTDDPTAAAFIGMMPETSTLVIKNHMLRFDQDVAGGGKQSFVANDREKSNRLLMSFMGQEYQVNLNREQLLRLEQTKELEITKTSERKMIAGYQCNLAKSQLENTPIEIYYAPEIKTPTVLPQFSSLEGLPLKYEVVKGSVHMVYEAIKVEQKPISDMAFDISNSVKEIPFDKFAETFAVKK